MTPAFRLLQEFELTNLGIFLRIANADDLARTWIGTNLSKGKRGLDMRAGLLFGSLAILPAFFSSPAMAAEECGPLKEITTLEATRLPDSSVLTVNAMLNGKARPMIVQTGAMISTLRESALEDLGAKAIANSNIIVVSGRTQSSQKFTQLDSFSLGAFGVARMQFQVPPDTAEERPWAGVLASDVFSLYDMEVDAAGRKIRFFDKKHCDGQVLYWNPTAIAILPFQSQLATADRSRTGFNTYFERGSGIYVPVTLDGKNVIASVSTGSDSSAMGARMAKFIFGVTADSPGSTPQSSPDGNPANAPFLHVFPTLTFDTVTVTNARVLVYPEDDSIAQSDVMGRSDTRLRRDNSYFVEHMTIGMNILQRLRLYIAYSERKLYITPATAPAAPAK